MCTQDDCIGCCLGNTFYGVTWQTTAQMSTARVPCSQIHSSFAQSSFIERECGTGIFSNTVSFRNCVFKPEAMTNLLLYTAILPPSRGPGIENATLAAKDVQEQVFDIYFYTYISCDTVICLHVCSVVHTFFHWV